MDNLTGSNKITRIKMEFFYKIVDGIALDKIEADDIQEAAEISGYWDYHVESDCLLEVTGGEEFDEGIDIVFSTSIDY